jgi:hypothetical protein
MIYITIFSKKVGKKGERVSVYGDETTNTRSQLGSTYTLVQQKGWCKN